MENKLTQQEALDLLNSLLVGYEFLECLDKVTMLSNYRHGLKEKVKSLLPVLEKFTEPLGAVTGVNDAGLFQLLEEKKELMKKISSLKPEYKAGMNELLNQFFNQPELTLHRLGIIITK